MTYHTSKDCVLCNWHLRRTEFSFSRPDNGSFGRRTELVCCDDPLNFSQVLDRIQRHRSSYFYRPNLVY